MVQVNLDQGAKNRARDHVESVLARLVPPTLQADREGADRLVSAVEANLSLHDYGASEWRGPAKGDGKALEDTVPPPAKVNWP